MVFCFKNEVLSVKVEFASEILDFIPLRRGTFIKSISDFVPWKQCLNVFTVYDQKYNEIHEVSSSAGTDTWGSGSGMI